MKQIYVLLSIFVITFFVFSADKYAQLMDVMYTKEALAVELNEPSMISLSDKELKYHSDVAIMLMLECLEEDLKENLKIAEMRESYARALYKIEIMDIEPPKLPREFTYYIYVFIDDNTKKKSIDQWLNVVCVLENNKEAILNSGFTKDCTVNNNWLHWKKGNCPDTSEIEHKLKKAFHFEQLEGVKKAPEKERIKT